MSTHNIKINRRDFLKWTALAAAGITVTANLGCESSDDDSGSDDTAGTADIHGSIGSNHGHSVTLSGAQQDAGAAVTLTLTTGNGHTHSIGLSAEQVQSIAAGGTVSKDSSTEAAHDHSVTFG